MSDQTMYPHITITNTIGRAWTITIDRAVVGYRWTVYLHHEETAVAALEQLHPGGTAHGWTDDDPEDARRLLVAIMQSKGEMPFDGSRGHDDHAEAP